MEDLAPQRGPELGVLSPVPDANVVERHFARRGRGEEFEMEARWIARQIPPSVTRVLDIGCGIGALFPCIGIDRVVGLDYAQPGLRRTRQAYPAVSLTCGDAAGLPFADESFGAITVQHVIEHLLDVQRAIAEWSRVLCPGGVVIVMTPNAKFRDPVVFDDPTHIRIFDPLTLRSEFELGSFEVERIFTLGPPWLREYHGIPAGWRMRRAMLRNAETLARLPFVRTTGQSLCCVARKRESA